MEIRLDNLSGDKIKALLSEHLESMADQTPAESMHALNLDELQADKLSFWSAWNHNDLLGCGALMQITPDLGEIKSMRTQQAHLRKGVGKGILQHIIIEATARNYSKLYLETGSSNDFIAARKMYEERGFTYCAPFANYKLDPLSAYMTLNL